MSLTFAVRTAMSAGSYSRVTRVQASTQLLSNIAIRRGYSNNPGYLFQPSSMVRGVRSYGAGMNDLAAELSNIQQQNPVVVFGTSWCPFCDQVKQLMDHIQVQPKIVDFDKIPNGDQMKQILYSSTGQQTVPQVFIANELLGGCDDTMRAYQDGSLKTKLDAAGVEGQF